MKNATKSKLPHSLRLTVFFLRLTLGLNFFYLGFSTIFNVPLGHELGARSFASLYQWLSSGAPTMIPAEHIQLFFQWAFLIIGACLIAGLFTRLASIIGIGLTLAGYLPTVNFAAVNASQFINDEILVIVCLLVLVAANAGSYLGIDGFMHIHFALRDKKSEE